jgi:hypothetical protein
LNRPRDLPMLLALRTELGEVFDCFFISVMARAFKNLLKITIT